MGLFFSVLAERELVDLVAEAKANDRDNSPEMNEIVRRFRERVTAIAYRICYNAGDRDDVISEMLLEIVRTVRAHDTERDGFVTYLLFRVMSHGRRISQRLALEPDCIGDDAVGAAYERLSEGIAPAADASAISAFGDLTAAVRNLPLRQRTAVYYHLSEDRPVGEVARIEGVTPAAITQRLSSAYSTLRLQVA